MQKWPIFDQLIFRLEERRRFIQVLLGPRQVGKATLPLQVAEMVKKPWDQDSHNKIN